MYVFFLASFPPIPPFLFFFSFSRSSWYKNANRRLNSRTEDGSQFASQAWGGGAELPLIFLTSN